MGIGAIDQMSMLGAFKHARQVKVIRVRITLAPSLEFQHVLLIQLWIVGALSSLQRCGSAYPQHLGKTSD